MPPWLAVSAILFQNSGSRGATPGSPAAKGGGRRQQRAPLGAADAAWEEGTTACSSPAAMAVQLAGQDAAPATPPAAMQAWQEEAPADGSAPPSLGTPAGAGMADEPAGATPAPSLYAAPSGATAVSDSLLGGFTPSPTGAAAAPAAAGISSSSDSRM